MEWQPHDEPLRQLACCLRDSLNPRDATAQKQAEQMLIQATSSPDYVNYITYLFSTPQTPPAVVGMDEPTYHLVRFAAAINLKTKIKVAYRTIPQPSLAYIRSATLVGLRDANVKVRSSAGSIITELVAQAGLLAWPEVLHELLNLVGNAPGDVPLVAQEAAMSALAKVCEDNRKILDRDYQGQRPLDVIIPKLLEFTSSESAKVRSMALVTIHVFLPHRPQALIASMDLFLSQLFRLADDPNPDVRKTVCQSFVQLVDFAPERLIPHMDGLVSYIIMQQQNQEDPELALDAAEFWLVAGEHKKLQQPMAPHMPKIVPVLLQSMIYDEDDAIRLTGDEDDADLEDREEDLRPQFAKSKGARLDTGKPPQANGSAPPEEENDDDLSEGEIEDSEFGDDPEDEWTLRKCSAAALDVFSNVYHQPIFEIILPYLKETLRHEQWPNREAAVLTLGAVADGCMTAVTPHLPELVPYLISLLNDAQPVVRQITCWCLGRYSEWASHLADPSDKARFFEPMMEGILHRMLDRNKKVQEAAASAFATLEEKSDANLIPYCEPILRQFVQCFGKYKDRNMYILYDCVQTLGECVMSELAKPHLVDILMPALIDRYNMVSDQSRELFPLLECLGYIAAAYGDAFAPFAPPLFQRCIKIIYENLQAYLAAVNNQTTDEPDKDFLVTSLDLLSAIIQAIDPQKSGELVTNSQPRFFDLLSFCMEDPNYEVRQSSYALLGDCAISIFPQLEPFIPNIMRTLIKQLDLDLIRDEDRHTGFSVLNNACWSCGEIAVNEKAALSPYLDKLYHGLFIIVNNEEIVDSVNENAAMALGRLGLCCPDQLAPRLGEYAESFLKSMAKIDSTREKASAFLGFNQVVMKNPQAMEASLADYFQSIAAFPTKSLNQDDYSDIQSSFQQVLQGYKTMIPNFDSFLSQLPNYVSQKLRSVYQV